MTSFVDLADRSLSVPLRCLYNATVPNTFNSIPICLQGIRFGMPASSQHLSDYLQRLSTSMAFQNNRIHSFTPKA